MTSSNNKREAVPVLSLGAEFGGLVVQGASVRVELDSEGGVTVYSNGSVKVRPAAADPAPANDATGTGIVAAPQIGDKMPDGTIFAGISPSTNEPMYTTPADAPGIMNWEQAKSVATLEAHGHKDWRLPSKAELSVLFNNRAAIGGFNANSLLPAVCYWSSAENNGSFAWLQSFSDGRQHNGLKNNGLSVRCVRG